MVNVHEKYPDGAVNKAAYSTDGSNVRDATEEKKTRYRDANKHRRKKVDEKSSSSEPSHSGSVAQSVALSKARPASTRPDRGGGDASSAERSGASKRTKERECPGGGDKPGSMHASSDRDSSRPEGRHEPRTPVGATRGEGEADEEELDRRNLAEIQGRIEARSAAKDLETARAMILQLQLSGVANLAVATSLTREGKVGDKRDKEKKSGSTRGSTKVPSTSPATETAALESARPVDLVGLAPVGNLTSATEAKKSRAGKRATGERRPDDALSTLKFSAIAESRSHADEGAGNALEVELGIAFVAGALGRKVPAILSTPESFGMSDCYVELTSTRKKSKATVSDAPPNSVESEDLGATDCNPEARFSQSDVQVGFPEDTSEAMTAIASTALLNGPPVSDTPRSVGAFAFANAIFGVVAQEEVATEPMDPAIIPETASSAVDLEDPILGGGETPPGIVTERMVPGSEKEAVALKLKYDNRQRMIREIAASQLLQEELAKSDPNLVSVFAFMNKVCGTDTPTRKLKEAALSTIQKGEVAQETEMQPEVRLTVRENLEQATAPAVQPEPCGGATSPETREGDTAVDGVVTGIGEAACGEGTRITATETVIREDAADPTVTNGVPVSEELHVPDETDIISLVDTIMSLGDSSSDNDLSPSTCGSSVSASGTRKRLADGSPERDREVGSRRKFPGRETRSAAGCCVYVPTVKNDGGDWLGRVLNDDGTFTARVTINQDEEPGTIGVEELVSGALSTTEAFVSHRVMTSEDTSAVPTSPVMSSLSSAQFTSTPDPILHPPIDVYTVPEEMSTPDLLARVEYVPDVPACIAEAPVAGRSSTPDHESTHVVVLVDEFGRDTCVVNEVCQMMEEMPRPWSAYRVFEAATARFPNIDRAALRLTVLAVLMGQRRCINRVTMAGINSTSADDYRNSY